MRTASLLLMLLGLIVGSTAARACDCRRVRSACLMAQAPGSIVFVGRITEPGGDGWDEPLARASVEERVANVPPGLEWVEVDNRSPCAGSLPVGERYIFIGRRQPDGKLHFPAGVCGGAFPAAGNERILDALRQQAWGGESRLMGSVLRADRMGTLLRAVTVTAVNRRGVEVYQTQSGHDGRYEFAGLAPGRYELSVARERFVPDREFNSRWSGRVVPGPEPGLETPDPEDPGLVEIASRSACEERDLAMLPNGEVAGTVRGEDGRPVAGVPVELFEARESEDRYYAPLRSAVSDEFGGFRFEGVPAGEYVAGVNLPWHSREKNAYPPARSGLVRLEEHEAKSGVDVTVLPPRREFKVEVTVVDTHGAPVKDGFVYVMREEEDQGRSLAPLQEGVAPVRLFEGGAYLIEAFSGTLHGSLRAYAGSTPPASLVVVVAARAAIESER